ncbi:MAG: amino acid transporter-like protein [Deltaproteobacteria bacterium]|nr:amino acid transporter-like protein [Deltaproteobacteria bacterium]
MRPSCPKGYAVSVSLRERLFGRKKDFRDPSIFHHVSLVALLAWVGLGADGLSSSAYGPEEAFKSLGEGHRYMAIFLALAVALTVFVISYGYSRIIEQFPQGGGGYVVASKHLGPYPGLVSGSALLVDYVLTIAVSVASAGDAVFSFLPPGWHEYKLGSVLAVLAGLTVLNLRGVKESILILTPIFLIFLVSHAVLIGGAVFGNLGRAGEIASRVSSEGGHDLGTIGLGAMALIFLRAFSLGGGTFTGIEAVSNGLGIMREPRVRTGKRTMVLMATSLSITAGGILLAYLLMGVDHAAGDPRYAGQTLNAVLADLFAGHWTVAGIHVGKAFVIVTLVAEGALLIVAAQAGFVDGPRVMSNMALDQWLPSRFASLSEQLTMHNGVYLMAGAAALVLVYTGGDLGTLVVMYSINVFMTFSLSNFAMMRHWWQVRHREPWKKAMAIHALGLVLCLCILTVTIIEKFSAGGWVTLVITGAVVALCLWVKAHYRQVAIKLARLSEQLSLDTIPAVAPPPPELDMTKPTAVVLAGGFGGLGIHTLLQIPRLFPDQFEQVVFVSVGVLDAGSFKGAQEVDALKHKTELDLARYAEFARTRMGWAADIDYTLGTEAVAELERLCREVSLRFPRSVFFAGKLIFRHDSWWQRLLHNETAHAVQRRLEFDGLTMVVLPIRMLK